MTARMNNPAMILPEAMNAVRALGNAGRESGLSEEIAALATLRASQINGCSVCVDMHSRQMKDGGESDERLFSLAAWRDAPYFTDAERAALALAESVTRLSDREDPVPDKIWEAAAKHFNERELAGLIVAIATINVWNRLNVATRQEAGQRW
ncbi:MAG: carboxymuconolactone decarboxylase family protein [Candidatus Dormibacteria bacterium]